MQEAQPPLFYQLLKVRDLSERVPTVISLGLAVILLAPAILGDWGRAGDRAILPLYYLIPLGILAWFFGWRPVLLATVLAAGLSAIGLILAAPPSPLPVRPLLGRLITFSAALLLGRVLSTSRHMLDYYLLGDQLRAQIVPIRIGDRMVSIPTRDQDIREFQSYLDDGDIPLLIRPGMAFGSGSHPTTQMCLLLLEEYLQPGQLVFDFGSGSGILSIAAVKLGARQVFAVDVAPVAERVIHENIELNRLENSIRFRLGSWPLLMEPSPENGWLEDVESPADLLVGNLLSSILVEALQQGLDRCVVPGGRLILSGILADHRSKIQAALDETGLVVVEWQQIEEWLAVVVSVPERTIEPPAAR